MASLFVKRGGPRTAEYSQPIEGVAIEPPEYLQPLEEVVIESPRSSIREKRATRGRKKENIFR
jgi:hypothetical protein